jgi:hypothetical protein
MWGQNRKACLRVGRQAKTALRGFSLASGGLKQFQTEGKHSESCRFRRRQAAWNAIEQDLFRR